MKTHCQRCGNSQSELLEMTASRKNHITTQVPFIVLPKDA
jgi:hypothetical protein